MSVDSPFAMETLWWAALFLLDLAAALWLRPLLPVDETRYLSVAWEMWRDHQFLVPTLNGLPYSHKPPLLFWLIHLVWSIGGVHEWSARLVVPVFALASLLLLRRLASRLWPQEPLVQHSVPFFLLGLPFWAFMGTLTLFDVVLTFWILAAVSGILDVRYGHPWRGWAVAALAMAAGLLTKGPVVFVFVAPIVLLAPLWAKEMPVRSWGGWYAGAAAAFVVAALLALCWAIPAAHRGGPVYGHAILWGQTAGRVIHSFAHRKPFWWYLPLLPLVFLPWSLWTPWLARRDRLKGDDGLRLVLCWVAVPIIVLSFVSGKQIHYLLPVVPGAVLGIARLVHAADGRSDPRMMGAVGALLMLCAVLLLVAPELPVSGGDLPSLHLMSHGWGVALVAVSVYVWKFRRMGTVAAVRVTATVMTFLFLLVHLGPMRELSPAYDLSGTAAMLSRMEAQGIPIASVGDYKGEYHFLGRLRRPVTVLNRTDAVARWAWAHPQGALIVMCRRQEACSMQEGALYEQRYRSRWVSVWKAEDFMKRRRVGKSGP
ncbi:ArnT family glycosyltransferase [Desulfacinum hydrothermale]|nr:glycosyltransferase family 39 protein [Desulfacinum hydrothermale]